MMPVSKLVTLVVVVAMLSAGCTSKDREATNSEQDEQVGTIGAPDELLLEDCHMIRLNTDMPASWVEDRIPKDFRIPFAQSGLAEGFVIVLDCARVVQSGNVTGPAVLVEAAVRVVKNFDVGDNPVPRFVLASYSDSSVIRDAYRMHGVSVEPMNVSTDATLNGLVPGRSIWTFEGNGFSFDLEAAETEPSTRSFRHILEYWHLGRPYTMEEAVGSMNETSYDVPSAAVISFSGPSQIRDMFNGGDRWVFHQYDGWNGEWQITLTGGIEP